MKKHLEIIKGLGLIFLLFVSVGVVAGSDSDDNIHTVSVTIKQVSESENSGDPVANNYEKEITTTGSTDVRVNGKISNGEASLTISLGDTTTSTDDTTTIESDDPVGMPEFKIGESPDEFNAKLSVWISSMLGDMDPIVNINDFMV